MREIVPVAQLGGRLPEAGRIRLGVKLPRGMKSIDTFRFTSPDQELIAQLAHLYGGQLRAWDDAKARIRNQFEVITEAKVIPIFLPADPLTVWYEAWTGGGVIRRCDGETCEIPGRDEPEEVPCLCDAQQKMLCRPYTRLNVVLPDVRFAGVWRLESKGWNVVQEMPAMEKMISALQNQGITRAQLALEPRSSMKNGRKENYVVPVLSPSHSPEQMLAGAGRVEALAQLPRAAELEAGPVSAPEPAAALPAGVSSHDATPVPEPAGDWTEEDIVDGEIVEEPFDTQFEKNLDKKQTAFLLAVKPVAEMLGVDDTSLRHALSWWASGKVTESSRSLDDAALSKGLRACDDFGSGRVPLDRLQKIVDAYNARDF